MHRARVRPRSSADVSSRRGFFRNRVSSTPVWIAVAIVLVLLLSEVPTAAAIPASAGVVSTPILTPIAKGDVGAPLPPKAPTSSPVVQVSSATDAASLCLLGVAAFCAPAPTSKSPQSPVPAAGPPSSWKDITPANPNPAARTLPAESYYPSGHEDLLFGGTAFIESTSETVYYGDTWAYANHVWTQLISNTSCTPSTCPSPRAGAMIAYYPPDNSLILFGGYIDVFFPPFYIMVAYADTWEFSGGVWTNITASAGAPPSPRFEGAMTYDPSDNEIVLFGGSNANGSSLGDTWTFSAGSWKNVTSSEGGVNGYKADPPVAPEPRAGAAIANSPSGYEMLFGGEDTIGLGVPVTIENNCLGATYEGQGDSVVAWWFYQGLWSAVGGWADTELGLCAPPPPPSPASPASGSTAPSPLAATPDASPPCGRVNPALGWSPQNNRFALYGGYGPYNTTANAVCDGPLEYLNDTYVYGEMPGGPFFWFYAGDAGDPSGRYEMGYVSDLTAGYFEIFGGIGGSGSDLGATWRFYEIVHADLTGPAQWDTVGINLVNQGPFIATGFGGSGDLSVYYSATPLRVPANNLGTGPGCGWFTNGTPSTLPFDGTMSFTCRPGPGSYNVYRLTAHVQDVNNHTDSATASWIFLVVPPEAMNIYSEYIGYFYSTVSFTNTFTIYTEVDGTPATRISASIGGSTVHFTQSGSNPKLWNANVDTGQLSAGTPILKAEAFFGGDWSQNATYDISEVSFPGWLLSVFQYAGATEAIKSQGAGPYNKSYIITESYSWNLENALGFSIPIELLGGDYDMIPSLTVVFTLTSQGDLSVTGTLPLTAPSITLGPASISVTITFTLSGTFDIVGTGVHWVSAEARISISADLSASIPIYGFSILGIDVGFYLTVSINPSVTLQLILAPATTPSQDLISGIGIMIQQFLGSFTLALSAAVNFGIGIASIGLGAGVSVALEFGVNPGFTVLDGWVNGSIFVTASFLWWSDSWNIVSGTIYSWDPAYPALAARDTVLPSGYNNNGTGTKWVTQTRYYASGDYDGYVWNAVGTAGPAVSDIYPYTEISGAAGYNGDYFFYTNDNTSQPITDGLDIAVGHLDASSNVLSSLPAVSDPGYYEIVAPQATTLPDGNLYVLWAGLPESEASISSPLNLTSLALQGAVFYPNNDTWGPIHTFSSARFAESYGVDATGTRGDVLELVSDTPLLSGTTPESLVEYNLTTGAEVANVSATDVSEIASFRGASGLAEIQDLGGNFSLINLATGAIVAVAVAPPAGYDLTSAAFVQGSASALVLLYRGGNGSELVLYDTTTGAPIGSLPLGDNTFEAEGIASGNTYYLFVRTTDGISGWTEVGATFTNLTTIDQLDTQSYGLVQVDGSIIVYSLATSGGNATFPLKSLEFDEIGASLAAVPVPAAARGTASPAPASSPDYALYLALVAGAVVLFLAVVFVATRRRPPAPPPTEASLPGRPTGPDPTAPAPPTPPTG
jgi:hypothetical protein